MGILTDFNKEGKGVSKNDKSPSNFSMFFIIYLRKFWSLMGLNILFIITSLPIITIGPSLAAGLNVVRKYTKGEVVLLLNDYFKAFKANFKQSFVLGILGLLITSMLCFAISFYFVQGTNVWFSYIISAFLLIVLVLSLCLLTYSFIMVVSVELKIKQIVKNALILMLTSFGRIIFVVVLSLFILFLSAILLPVSIILFALIIPALLMYISCYNLVGLIEEKVGESKNNVKK